MPQLSLKEMVEKSRKTKEQPKLPQPSPKIEIKTNPAPKKAGSFAAIMSKVSKSVNKEKEKKSRDVLYGTGLTKKILEAQQHAIEKENIIQKPLEHLVKKDSIPEPIPQPEIIKLEVPSDIEWDEWQLAALNGLKHDQYGCLIGAAGTGKTTVTKQIVKDLEHLAETIDLNKTRLKKDQKDEPDYAPAIAFCAFTGQAVRQMVKNLPKEYWGSCATIHATLGFHPVWDEVFEEKKKAWKTVMHFEPEFTSQNKLPYKIIVMDESGMTPITLWNQLIDALLPGCKIILIGDINQLPPVQGRSVLGFAMLNWPTYTLEHIHRQAADNPIIANCHRVLKGAFPVKDKKHFSMISLPPGSIKASNAVFEVLKKLHGMDMFDPRIDALIVPQNKDMLGQISLNEKLVHFFNPPREIPEGIFGHRQLISTGKGQVHYAVGDKIMLLQNDRKRGLTNGMTGFVISINVNGSFDRKRGNLYNVQSDVTLDMAALDNIHEEINKSGLEDLDVSLGKEKEDDNQRQATHIMTVRFEVANDVQEVTFSTGGQYATVTLCYACTCHKMQGSEARNVVIVVHSANSRMLCREWLYTAMSRGRERVILLYNDRGLLQALGAQRIKGITIEEKAKCFLALQDKADTSLPNLPEPRRV